MLEYKQLKLAYIWNRYFSVLQALMQLQTMQELKCFNNLSNISTKIFNIHFIFYSLYVK